jgi:beta-N-acetylhexosaminidase
MLKKFLPIIIILVILVLSIFAGYVFGQHKLNNKDNDNASTPSKKIGQNQPPAAGDDSDPIHFQIKDMSMEEKIGQLVIAGIDGYEIDAGTEELVEKYHVGGFILLKKNVRDTKQMHSLINSLKENNKANKIPLFLAIDEEGGKISRMPEEFTRIPASKKIGDQNNSELSYQIGTILGEELKAFGLNMDFAPVLDINSNPQNPVIGDRAFGDHTDIVTKLGIETMKGLQDQNIISVVKHFPGHGDTSVDSHVSLPTVNHDLERLESFELLPFSEAIKNKADAVMIAHILLPKIDRDHPSTFSKIMITDILREKMNFDGVVITDDMTMGAVTNNYDIGAAAVQSINAGSDIILVCHDYEKEKAVIQALLDAANSGTITQERIEQSVYRVLSLKKKYAVSDTAVAVPNPESINKKIEALYQEYPSLKE